MAKDFGPLPEFARIVRRDHSTAWRWVQKHPGLALKIGGRYEAYLPAAQAIASGTPLDQAATMLAAALAAR